METGKPDDEKWYKDVKPELWVPAGLAPKTPKILLAGFPGFLTPASKPKDLVQVGPCFLLASALEVKTMAERMLETAERFKSHPKGSLIIAGDGTSAFDVEFTAVCLKFAALPAATRLRAMVEKWDYNRIVQEIH